MLFNSYEFCFLFLPIVFALFWAWHSLRWRLTMLTVASFVFYSWWQFESWNDLVNSFRITSPAAFKHFLWHWRFTIVLLCSSSVDYFAARAIVASSDNAKTRRKALLALSLSVNLGLLAFFKYAGFFTQVANDVAHFLAGGSVPLMAVVLPVGISFYTFESMSYVIDIYRGVAKPARSYLDYACFISFFPHLVAGPIIRYSDILHQFRDVNWVRRGPDWEQINIGLVLFTMGMVKKLVIADRLADAINPLWDWMGRGGGLGVVGSWGAVLGYTFRIYFDFSGYSDMATGLGHLFAVRLPQNFDSPYKAIDAVDFWRRWHMTLSSWLRDYLYIPLGGNRNGKQKRNLMITMLLGGLWHGAAWLFVIWGAWHGLLLILTHSLKRIGLLSEKPALPEVWLRRQVTFLLIVVGWIFFRAADVHSGYGVRSITPAFTMMKQMSGLGPKATPITGTSVRGEPIVIRTHPRTLWAMIALAWLWCNFMPNSFQIAYNLRFRQYQAMAAGAAMAVCVLHFGVKMDFLYFRF